MRELAGLPELVLGGLRRQPTPVRCWTRRGPAAWTSGSGTGSIAESRGNPLALLELPRGLTPAELAGGFGLPDAAPAGEPDRAELPAPLESLPDATRRLLLAAAAEPVGDVALLWRAAERLGIGADAAAPAQTAGLIELGARVRFRHPLVRSAVYRRAPVIDRQQVHRALAEATDPEADPDRRAWHRAHAAAGPRRGRRRRAGAVGRRARRRAAASPRRPRSWSERPS